MPSPHNSTTKCLARRSTTYAGLPQGLMHSQELPFAEESDRQSNRSTGSSPRPSAMAWRPRTRLFPSSPCLLLLLLLIVHPFPLTPAAAAEVSADPSHPAGASTTAARSSGVSSDPSSTDEAQGAAAPSDMVGGGPSRVELPPFEIEHKVGTP